MEIAEAYRRDGKCRSGKFRSRKCRSDKVWKAIIRKVPYEISANSKIPDKIWLSRLSCLLVAKSNSQASQPVNVVTAQQTRFPTTSGVRQGCVLAPALFCVAIDWILNHMDANPGIKVGSSFFTDLVYADDSRHHPSRQ